MEVGNIINSNTILLLATIEKKLDKVSVCNYKDEKDRLFEEILKEIKQEEIKQDFYYNAEDTLSSEEFKSMLFYKVTSINILEKACSNNMDWLEPYTASLTSLAVFYFRINLIEKSIEIGKILIEKIEELYSNNPEDWEDTFTNLDDLAAFYFSINQVEEAIKIEEKTLEIVEDLYNNNPSEKADLYVIYIKNLATSYRNNNQLEKAHEIEQKVGLYRST